MIFLGFFKEEGLKFLQLFWILRGQIIRQTEVFLHVVKLPACIVIKRAAGLGFPRRTERLAGHGHFKIGAVGGHW